MENTGKIHKYLEKYSMPELNEEKLNPWLPLAIKKNWGKYKVQMVLQVSSYNFNYKQIFNEQMIIPNLPTHFQRTENEVGDMDSASKGKNQNAAVQQGSSPTVGHLNLFTQRQPLTVSAH